MYCLETLSTDSYKCKRKWFHTWKIHSFYCERVEGSSEVLPETQFNICLHSMQFMAKLYLTGNKCEERECVFELRRSDSSSEIAKAYAKCWVGRRQKQLVSVNLSRINQITLCLVEEREKETGSSNLSSRSNKLSTSPEKYLSTHCLLKEGNYTISCEVTEVYYSDNPKITTFPKEESTFKADMAELFSSQKHSDVILIVNGKELRAHKNILATRSTVFDQIFQLNVQKSSPLKINIIDFKKEVVYEMLRYIYTDEVTISDEMADELFAASNFYGLPRLKSMCEYELTNKISIANCIERLILADEYGAPFLRKSALSFIRTNIKFVAFTEGWESVLNKYFHTMLEIEGPL